MCGIKTLVYFNIEASGLKSLGRPRICEISLIAVNTQDVLIANNEDTQYCEVTFLPRIVNKMTLCGCYHSPFIRFDWTITTRVNSPHSTRTPMS